MQTRKTLPIVVVIAILLSACSTGGTTGPAAAKMDQPTPKMMGKPTQAMTDNSGEMQATGTIEVMVSTPTKEMLQNTGEMTGTATPVEIMAGEGKMMESPAWFSVMLTNVSDDHPFTINDFKGKVVLVETLAQWCPTCLRQQNQVKDLQKQLGQRDDFAILGLDIDPNEDANTLKSYVAKNGFNWWYAVAPAEVIRDIGNLYGAQFLNPPSTPMLIIDRQGGVHTLPFGVKSASDLMQAFEPYLNQGL